MGVLKLRRCKYYDLALKKCHSSDKYFSIHGLWPEESHTKWPSFCNQSSHFNLSQIKGLESEMEKVWFSCGGDNIDFWKHEYLKHGTCSLFNQSSYFNTTLNLFKLINQDKRIIEKYCNNNNNDNNNDYGLESSKLQCLIPFNKNLTIRN